mgnify:FL=1
MVKKYSVCATCGKEIAYTECSEVETPPEDPKCAVLQGWLTVSQWQGLEDIDRYDFCSFTCLQKWVNKKVPKIPKAFLKAFENEPK